MKEIHDANNNIKLAQTWKISFEKAESRLFLGHIDSNIGEADE